MTMKFTQLVTYWDAADAYAVITFLEELRDTLWLVYGDDIIEMHNEDAEKQHPTDDSLIP